MVKNSKNRVKITWSIDANLVKDVKHKAIDMDTDASTIVEKAIRKFLSGRRK